TLVICPLVLGIGLRCLESLLQIFGFVRPVLGAGGGGFVWIRVLGDQPTLGLLLVRGLDLGLALGLARFVLGAFLPIALDVRGPLIAGAQAGVLQGLVPVRKV